MGRPPTDALRDGRVTLAPSAILTAIALLNGRPASGWPAQETPPPRPASPAADSGTAPHEHRDLVRSGRSRAFPPGVSGNSNGRRPGVPKKATREVRTATPPPQTRLALELYSYQQLARIWHRTVETLQNWVSQDRRAGFPIYGVYRLNRRHQRREFLIRGDSAEAVWARHLGVQLTRYRPRRRRG